MQLEKFDISATYSGLKKFDCANEMINRFVQKSLKKRLKKHLSQAYILLNNNDIVGFYTLDTFAISKDTFELENSTGLPPMIPVIKLGMLGVDRQYQGKGIGKRLLRDTMLKVVEISEVVGCSGVYLLAESSAVGFYESLGFVKLREANPIPMFLHIEKIIKSYD